MRTRRYVARRLRSFYNLLRTALKKFISVKTLAVQRATPDLPLLTVVIYCKDTHKVSEDTAHALAAQSIRSFAVVLYTNVRNFDAASVYTQFRNRQDIQIRVEFQEKLTPWVGKYILGTYGCLLEDSAIISPVYLEKALFLLETYGYDVVFSRLAGNNVFTDECITLPHPGDFLDVENSYLNAVGKKNVWQSPYIAYKYIAIGTLQRFCMFKKAAINGGILASSAYVPQCGDNEQKPTLLLCYGIITNGGGEKLLSTIANHLHIHGWNIIIISSHEDGAIDERPVLWHTKAASAIFLLHTFLPDDESKEDFIQYLLANKKISVVLQAGSLHIYHLLPTLSTKFPHIRCFDLLFNSVWHTRNNKINYNYIYRTLVENSDVRDYLLSKGSAPEKVICIPSGVEVPPPEADAIAMLREKFTHGGDAIIFGFSGRLSPEKAPMAFLEIAGRCRDLSNVHFIMTGTGPLAPAIEEKLRSAAMTNFHFCGYVDNIYAYLYLYDILLVPSFTDGRPLVIMESMLCGTPCIASRVGGIPELISDKTTGLLVKPGDIDMFASKIRSLASDTHIIRKMSDAAKKFAVKNFRMDTMLNRYESVLRDFKQ